MFQCCDFAGTHALLKGFGQCFQLWQVVVIIIFALALHGLHLCAYFRASRTLMKGRKSYRWLAALPVVGAVAW